MSGMFEEFGVRHAGPFSRWAEAHMDFSRPPDAVFYPFSGPDFTFAHLLYPEAETYLLCGLEFCDLLPEWRSLSEDDADDALRGIVSGMSHFLRWSYFITKDMRETFSSSRLRGVLPFLLVFLARTGHRVESVCAVRLDADGTPVETRPSCQTPPSGICISFSKAERAGRLFYFQQDLRDDYCKADGPFLRFAASLGETAAFAKSASYLLHEPYFSNARDFIFAQCSFLVQDPSHMPYRSFAEQGWEVRLHGCYASTLPVFQKYEQPDLIQASRNFGMEERALEFGIGYLADPRTSSLMVAMPSRGGGESPSLIANRDLPGAKSQREAWPDEEILLPEGDAVCLQDAF